MTCGSRLPCASYAAGPLLSGVQMVSLGERRRRPIEPDLICLFPAKSTMMRLSTQVALGRGARQTG
jgi:hypothetical protein